MCAEHYKKRKERPVGPKITTRGVGVWKGPGLSRPGITREPAGAEPDDADPRHAMPGDRRKKAAEGPLAIVVAERRRCGSRAGALDAVHGRAVLQYLKCAVSHQPPAADAEEAARR